MVKSALITGISGQDGSYLSEFLLEKGYRVYGVIRRTSSPNLERIAHLVNDIELIPGDLLDQNSLSSALRQSKPNEVYNLAAQSFVATSWNQPDLTGAIDSHLVWAECWRQCDRLIQGSVSIRLRQVRCSAELTQARPRAKGLLFIHAVHMPWRSSTVIGSQ